jgi:hypothetical protein
MNKNARFDIASSKTKSIQLDGRWETSKVATVSE